MLPTAWFSAQRHVARSALLSPHGNRMLRRASSEPRRIHLRKYRLAIEAIAQRYMRFTASSSRAFDSAALSKSKLFGITDFDWIARRHGIKNRSDQFKMASTVIASITSSVTAK